MDKNRIGFLSEDFYAQRQFPILLFYDTKVELRVSPKDHHDGKVELMFLILLSNVGTELAFF